MKNITNNKNHNLNTRVCSVVRIYDEMGDYDEQRYDNISCEFMPEDVVADLISGEVICVELTPNAEVFYFVKPEDWPDNWTELGTHIKK